MVYSLWKLEPRHELPGLASNSGSWLCTSLRSTSPFPPASPLPIPIPSPRSVSLAASQTNSNQRTPMRPPQHVPSQAVQRRRTGRVDGLKDPQNALVQHGSGDLLAAAAIAAFACTNAAPAETANAPALWRSEQDRSMKPARQCTKKKRERRKGRRSATRQCRCKPQVSNKPCARTHGSNESVNPCTPSTRPTRTPH